MLKHSIPSLPSVLLLGNYPNDRLESMTRFARLLGQEIPTYGFETETLQPPVIFGRIVRAGHGLGKWLGYMDKFLLFPVQLRKRMRRSTGATVVHICDHSNAVYTQYLKKIPHLVTCHDLLALRSALGEFDNQRIRLTGRLFQRRILHGLNAAQRVTCVSSATKRDLLRLTVLEPRQVSLVYNGLNYRYAPLDHQTASARLRQLAHRLGDRFPSKLRPGFILHVGGNQWYKNRLGVLKTYAALLRNAMHLPHLLMVGKPFTREMRCYLSENHLENHVFEICEASNADLQVLYCTAELLLFPSLEEGFGWPIIEAQACGCRVATNRRPPMTEIGGGSALFFDASSPSEAALAVQQALMEAPELRTQRIERGLQNAARFSTDRMVESYVEMYRRLARQGSEDGAGVLGEVAVYQ